MKEQHNTPMVRSLVANQNKKLKTQSSQDSGTNTWPKLPHYEAIGSLLCATGTTHPDITYAINRLSRRQLEPTLDDWQDVKRVFRYQRGSTNTGLIFMGQNEKLEAYIDSSFCDVIVKIQHQQVAMYFERMAMQLHESQKHKCYSFYLSGEYSIMSDVCQEIMSIDKATCYILNITLYIATLY